MNRGKEICKELKGIRKAIAEENGIGMEFPECHHEGPCRGTCPRCEAELRQLEHELERRLSMGKVATVAGMALALTSPVVAGNSPMEAKSLPLPEYGTALPSEPDNTLLIPGLAPESEAKVLRLIVRDAQTNEEVPLASIRVYKGSQLVADSRTDSDGEVGLRDEALDFDSIQVWGVTYEKVTLTRDQILSLKPGEVKDGLKCLGENKVEVLIKSSLPKGTIGLVVVTDVDPTPASQYEPPRIEKQSSEGEAATNPTKVLPLRVVDYKKKDPIAMAHVYVYKDSTLLADDYTGGDGTIVFRNLDDDEVSVVVRKPGYVVGDTVRLTPTAESACRPAEYKTVMMTEAEVRMRVGGVEPVPIKEAEIPDPTGIRLLKVQY